jgi:hypothetical protein
MVFVVNNLDLQKVIENRNYNDYDDENSNLLDLFYKTTDLLDKVHTYHNYYFRLVRI